MRPHHRDECWSAGLWQDFFASCVGATVPALAELPFSACGCKKFNVDALGDHVSTCTAHSGAKKAHDWAVDQLADLFRTTHRLKTQRVVRSRGQRVGVIYCHSKFIVGQAPRLYNLPSEYMLQGHRYLDPPILGVQDVCAPSVDIPTPRTHTSNSVQNCATSPTTTLQ